MSASDFVLLRGGLTLPVAVLRLAWDLEERGLRLGADGDMVTIGPRALVTADDRRRIRACKPHLLALISYTADGPFQ